MLGLMPKLAEAGQVISMVLPTAFLLSSQEKKWSTVVTWLVYGSVMLSVALHG
jgi:hypothetical protein